MIQIHRLLSSFIQELLGLGKIPKSLFKPFKAQLSCEFAHLVRFERETIGNHVYAQTFKPLMEAIVETKNMVVDEDALKEMNECKMTLADMTVNFLTDAVSHQDRMLTLPKFSQQPFNFSTSELKQYAATYERLLRTQVGDSYEFSQKISPLFRFLNRRWTSPARRPKDSGQFDLAEDDVRTF